MTNERSWDPSNSSALRRELDVHREEIRTQNDDLRRANAALSTVKERYAQLYDSAPIAYFTVADDGTIVEMNIVGADLLCAPRNLLFGRKFDDFIVPSLRAAFRQFRAAGISEGQRASHDTYLVVDDRRFPARIDGTLLGAPEDNPVGFLLCVTDESERLRREDDRHRRRIDTAEGRRRESLDLLAGSLARDFHDMLSLALASIDGVLEGDSFVTPHRAAIQRTREIVDRATRFSREMLGYARPNRRSATRIDLGAVIRGTEDVLVLAAGGRGVGFDLPMDPLPIDADSAAVGRILLNLVMNAAEASLPGDAAIVVRARREAAADDTSTDTIALEVEDRGAGMDERTRRRAFDPLFSTKGPSRGIGLAVVHANVLAHGGTLSLAPRLHGGTLVRIAFPVASDRKRA